MRKRRMMLASFLIIFSILIGACVDHSPEKAIKRAENEVRAAIIAEESLIYYNGKNFLVVKDADYAVAILVMQDWIDSHPDKILIPVSPGWQKDAEGDRFVMDSPRVWVAYVIDKKDLFLR